MAVGDLHEKSPAGTTKSTQYFFGSYFMCIMNVAKLTRGKDGGGHLDCDWGVHMVPDWYAFVFHRKVSLSTSFPRVPNLLLPLYGWSPRKLKSLWGDLQRVSTSCPRRLLVIAF